MENKSWIILLLLFAWHSQLLAQEKKGNKDIGINVTSVISAFVGNDNDIRATDVPFLLRFGEASKLRIGFGAGVKSNEFFDVISLVTRTTQERQFLARVGFQKNIFKEDKWGTYWGLDGIASYTVDQVKSDVIGGSNRILKQIIGLGGGPILGVTFNITDRIYLSTEASLYTVVSIVEDRESGAGLLNSSVTTFNFDLQAAPPLFLYLNYAF